MVRGTVMEYHAQFGNLAEMHRPCGGIQTVDAFASGAASGAARFHDSGGQLHDWTKGSWEKTMGLITKAIDLATELGSHFHLGILYAHAVITALEMNDLDLAKEFLGRIDQLDFTNRRVMESLHRVLRAFYHLAKNSPAEAHRAAEKGLCSALECGACIPEAYGRICLACVLRKAGKAEDATAQLDMVETMLHGLGVTHSLYLVRLTRASLLFDRGDVIEARRILREAFDIGRIKGYGVTPLFLVAA